MVESCCRHEEGLMHFVVHVQLFLFFLFLYMDVVWKLWYISCVGPILMMMIKTKENIRHGTLSVLSRPVPSCFRGKYNQPFSPPGAQWNGYSVQMCTHKSQHANFSLFKSKRNLIQYISKRHTQFLYCKNMHFLPLWSVQICLCQKNSLR